MNIMDRVTKLPGGLMLIPLLIGALLKTFYPQAPDYFQGFTKGLMTGVTPILGVWFFCMGTSIDFKSAGVVLKKSGSLVVTKLLTTWIVAIIAAHFIPSEGIQTGLFAGLSVLAIVCSMDHTNAGLYSSLMQTYGTKEEAGAFVLTSIEAGPVMGMLILGATGAASFEPRILIGAILPFIIGIILSNLDRKIRIFFQPGCILMIPFFAFTLGNSLDLRILMSPLAFVGIILGLSVIVITGIPLILADKYIGGGNGTAGIAASSTAGAAAANPLAIAAVIPQFLPVAPAATTLVAISVVVTSIFVPIVTAFWFKRYSKQNTASVLN